MKLNKVTCFACGAETSLWTEDDLLTDKDLIALAKELKDYTVAYDNPLANDAIRKILNYVYMISTSNEQLSK
jgi:hypothetical protein